MADMISELRGKITKMSEGELSEMIDHLQEDINKINEEMSSLFKEREIQEKFLELCKVLLKSASTSSRSSDLLKQDTLVNACIFILGEVQKSCSLERLLELLVQYGYQFKAQDPIPSIRVTLSRNDNFFKKVGPSEYALHENWESHRRLQNLIERRRRANEIAHKKGEG